MNVSRIKILFFMIAITAIFCQSVYALKPINTKESGDKQIMTQGILKLSQEEFWSNPFKNRDAIEDELLDLEKDTVLVDAPKEFIIGANKTLPIVVLRVAQLSTLNSIEFEKHAVITATNRDTQQTYTALAIFREGRNVAPSVASLAEAQPGMGGEAFVIDAIERLKLPIEPANYVFSLIVRDQVFTSLSVEFKMSPAHFIDPEVQKFKEKEKESAEIPRPWPVFLANNQSIENSIQENITLSINRVSIIGDSKPLILTGSYNTPVLPEYIINSTDKNLHKRAPWIDDLPKTVETPAAIISITLVVTSSFGKTPHVWHLKVPHYGKLADTETSTFASGAFAIDLMKLGILDKKEQTWFLYAITDDFITRPQPIAFVKPKIPTH